PAEAASAPPTDGDAEPAESAQGTSGPPEPAEPAQATSGPPEPAVADADGPPPYASPLARRMARELGVDLAVVHGTGRNGRIVRADIETAAAAPEAAAGAPAAGLPGIAPWPHVDFAKYGEIERVPLSRIRKISGPNLARNWVMIPHVTQHDEADITELEAFRRQLNAEQSDVKVTMVALLLKACVASLQEFPDFNSSLNGDDLVVKRYYHLGFAADTPLGLVVPVIRDVDKKGLI